MDEYNVNVKMVFLIKTQSVVIFVTKTQLLKKSSVVYQI